MTAAETQQPRPSRLVDAHYQGWYGTQDGTYTADYCFSRGLQPATFDEITERRGPTRPVLPATEKDQQTLQAALQLCGRSAVTTMAAALAETAHRLADRPAPRSVLIAGREGSWESDALLRVTSWGATLGQDRVRAETQPLLVAMFASWVTNPARYTEVAETIAVQLGAVVDGQSPAGPAAAWALVADDALHPGGGDAAAAEPLYLYLMSHAAAFDAAWAGDQLCRPPRHAAAEDQ